SCLVLSCLGSCSQQIVLMQSSSTTDSLANRMRSLQVYGYFPSVNKKARSISVDAVPEEIDSSKMEVIATQPEYVLSEIQKEQKGEEQLALIDAMLSENSTAQNVADKMRALDPALAEDYENNLISFIENLPVTEKSRIIIQNKKDLLRDIKLRQEPFPRSRAILSSDIEWNTVWWYVGYCATTMAGLAVYKWSPEFIGWFWTGWLRWVGLGTAAGGASLMTSQLIIWGTQNPEIKDLVGIAQNLYTAYNAIQQQSTPEGAVSAMKAVLTDLIQSNKLYSKTVKEILLTIASEYFKPHYTFLAFVNKFTEEYIARTDMRNKLLTIGSSTLGPVGFCYFFTREVFEWLVGGTIKGWNGLCNMANTIIPDTNITIMGVPLKPIKF
ncbi:MAG TPA: hypothetical protein PLW34_11130, partial [Termitinemataceae bacterium]|nr:hypothetical protein [Termitinemataceae bacterium]HOM24324.1 hypothetical protein [Termitinemataceae bacterium]HPQ01458.1 hypothetical protein [Termitinemataceae bacterium]